MIEGLGYVRLEVSDLERSLAFYCDGLRFDLEDRDDGDRPRAFLHAGALRVVLTQVQGVDHLGNGVRLSMEVSGLDAYHDAIVARGVRPTPPADTGSVRAFSVSDPDGYCWRFEQSLA